MESIRTDSPSRKSMLLKRPSINFSSPNIYFFKKAIEKVHSLLVVLVLRFLIDDKKARSMPKHLREYYAATGKKPLRLKKRIIKSLKSSFCTLLPSPLLGIKSFITN